MREAFAIFTVIVALTGDSAAQAAGPDIVLADFEAKDYGDWKTTGEAFGPGPAQGTLPHQMDVSGYLGHGLVNTFYDGDEVTGTLTSPAFTIQRKKLSFLIGGGDHEQETCINLLIDGKIVRTDTGRNNERLEPSCWNVLEFAGQQAAIQIIDKHTGGWGHIAVDQIVQTDQDLLTRMSMEYNCPSVNKRFLHLPISFGARSVWVNIRVDGVWQRELSIALARDKPDCYVTLEVGHWLGKQLTLTAEKVYSDSQWSKLIKLSDDLWEDDTVYTEKYRPQFHFTVRHGGLGDPNGLVYFGDEYHLFGQHRAFQGENSGGLESTVWAHAIGSDPFHWVEHPIAILPDKLGVPFSGSGVVDWRNTAGLVKNPVKDKNGRLENPAIVVFYTSEPTRTRNGGNTTQSMAYSLDSGRTWIMYPGNPIVPHFVPANRDPKVFWYEDKQNPGHPHSGRWIMALYLSGPDYALLASKDLIHWERIGGVSDIGCVECPDMFELPVDGNQKNTRWVFWGGNGNHVIGTFDGRTFTRESGPFSTHAGNEYAAQTFSDVPEEDGRRIQLADLYGDVLPGMPFRNQFTIPRVLSLRTTADGIRLFIEPAKEIEKLRTGETLQISRALAGVDAPFKGEKNLGELVDAEAVFEIQSDALSREGANVLGLTINGQTILCDLDQKRLKILDLVAPLSAVDHTLKLRVILDRMSIEVFVNDGAFRLTKPLVPQDGMQPGIQVFGKQGIAVVRLKAHQLQSVWKKEVKPLDPLPKWEMGPFVKRPNPVLSPTPDSRFQCPILGKEVRWEEQNVYNPAAVVRNGMVYLLYRADDKNPALKWGRTCRIGLASSKDGTNFARHPTPVLYPDNDPWKQYEWEGGCEDLHVVEGEDGVYYMSYTTWSGSGDTMSVASSRDLIHWTKHGPAFRKATPENVGGRSGVVISRLVGDRLVAAKIKGKYWMYYTRPCALAWSDNLIDWTRAEKFVGGGHQEAGAIALLRDKDIVLMFNTQAHDNPAWTIGQALIDRDDLTSVLRDLNKPFFYPELDWEKVGFVPNTTVANTLVPFNGRWCLYYGGADRCIGLAVFTPKANTSFLLSK